MIVHVVSRAGEVLAVFKSEKNADKYIQGQVDPDKDTLYVYNACFELINLVLFELSHLNFLIYTI